MRPVCIVVEALTEKNFVDNCLQPYLSDYHGLYDVSARILGKPGHKGGRVAYSRVKTDVDLLLKQRGDAVVTTFFDYYGMGTDFPGYTGCQKQPYVDGRIDCLEQNLALAIDSWRFIPYIQKHEFEALLFASGIPLTKYLSDATCTAIDSVRGSYNTPEDINSGDPPSYRLDAIFRKHEKVGYKKTTNGPILALELGIQTLMSECPRFAGWLQRVATQATKDK